MHDSSLPPSGYGSFNSRRSSQFVRTASNERLETGQNHAFNAVATQLPSLGTRHASVRMPCGDVDAVVDDGHALDVFDGISEGMPCSHLDAFASGSERPSKKLPCELGVSRFVARFDP